MGYSPKYSVRTLMIRKTVHWKSGVNQLTQFYLTTAIKSENTARVYCNLLHVEMNRDGNWNKIWHCNTDMLLEYLAIFEHPMQNFTVHHWMQHNWPTFAVNNCKTKVVHFITAQKLQLISKHPKHLKLPVFRRFADWLLPRHGCSDALSPTVSGR